MAAERTASGLRIPNGIFARTPGGSPTVALFCLLLALLAFPGQPHARTRVDLELVLAVDTSGSVDMSEYRLQMRGLALAFRDPAIIAAIQGTGAAGIAVTLVHWSSAGEQRQIVAWTRIHDSATSRRFAGMIEARPDRRFYDSTGIGAALEFSERLIRNNRFEGRRKSIDISADGVNNSGVPPEIVRESVLARGVTINGLAILDETPHLHRYFAQNVIGGPGAFVMTAASYADIVEATRTKLLREISVSVADWKPSYAIYDPEEKFE